jgi:hypothetical protein
LSVAGFSTIIESVYGRPTVDLHLGTVKFIDSDIVLIKLALSLFALSEITYLYSLNISTTLTNLINILKIQKFEVTLILDDVDKIVKTNEKKN